MLQLFFLHRGKRNQNSLRLDWLAGGGGDGRGDSETSPFKGEICPICSGRPRHRRSSNSLVFPTSGLGVIFSCEEIVFVCFLLFFFFLILENHISMNILSSRMASVLQGIIRSAIPFNASANNATFYELGVVFSKFSLAQFRKLVLSCALWR